MRGNLITQFRAQVFQRTEIWKYKNLKINKLFYSTKVVDVNLLNMQAVYGSFEDLGIGKEKSNELMSKISSLGFKSTAELLSVARDLVDKPEMLTSVLKQDFQFSICDAHILKSSLLNILRKSGETSKYSASTQIKVSKRRTSKYSASKEIKVSNNETTTFQPIILESTQLQIPEKMDGNNETTKYEPMILGSMQLQIPEKMDGHDETTKYQPLILDSTQLQIPEKMDGKTNNPPASMKLGSPAKQLIKVDAELTKRYADSKVSGKRELITKATGNYYYGIQQSSLPPHLEKLLADFQAFMTKYTPMSQEPPLRKATSDVYLRHARLFLGWFMAVKSPKKEVITLYSIFPDKEKSSATAVFEFVYWLKDQRQISSSYEANFIRGLTKLAKFRYSTESSPEGTAIGRRTFEDIPAINELRKLHRDASKNQKNAPRVSDEKKKWLSWPEFLGVVNKLKEDLQFQLDTFKGKQNVKPRKKQEIATVYQTFILLSMITFIPDRSRTFRELEINSNFLRDEGRWTIKHGPKDYKTGYIYGDRPPLVLPEDLTPAIDDFIENWRPALNPTTEKLFAQETGGGSLTAQSLHYIVTRTCFKYTGQKTNPHLLRDMIVTHVRGGDATEKQLEALALYMGHSLNMQRNSYDRRTTAQKVAPAIELLDLISKTKA